MPITANGTVGLERLERRLDARVGDRAQLAFRDLDRREAEHVARRDPEELAPLEPPQPGAAMVDVRAPLQRLHRRVDELTVAVLARRARRRRRGAR